MLLSLDFCRSVSQNSSVLHEEDDERSCSESDTQLSQRPSAQHLEEVISVSISRTLDGGYFCLASLSRSICFHSLLRYYGTFFETGAKASFHSSFQQYIEPMLCARHCSVRREQWQNCLCMAVSQVDWKRQR